jgi:hypothetical protein
VPKSRQRNASDSEIESLWQTNDRRSLTQVTILDALTDGLAPFPSVTEFRPPTESSEPCSHSIRKAENPKFSAFIFRPGGLIICVVYAFHRSHSCLRVKAQNTPYTLWLNSNYCGSFDAHEKYRKPEGWQERGGRMASYVASCRQARL